MLFIKKISSTKYSKGLESKKYQELKVVQDVDSSRRGFAKIFFSRAKFAKAIY